MPFGPPSCGAAAAGDAHDSMRRVQGKTQGEWLAPPRTTVTHMHTHTDRAWARDICVWLCLDRVVACCGHPFVCCGRALSLSARPSSQEQQHQHQYPLRAASALCSLQVNDTRDPPLCAFLSY